MGWRGTVLGSQSSIYKYSLQNANSLNFIWFQLFVKKVIHITVY